MKKRISLILCLANVCSLLLLPPAAAEEAADPPEEEILKTVVEEVADSRGEFEKHYLCSDGNYIALSYPGAVHYETADGWQDIDNRLFFDEESKGYRNMGNPSFGVTFGAYTGADLLRLDGFSYSVDAYAGKEALPLDADALAAPVIENGKEQSPVGKPIDDPDSFTLPFVGSKITYEKLFKGGKADIEYTVTQNKVKENIILQEGSPIDCITYTVHTDYEAVKQEDGSVVFRDGEEAVYTIGVPYLYDAADADPCYDIGVAVEGKDGTVTVSYTLNKEWLAEAEYPVVLDPTIKTSQYYSNIEDTYIEEYETQNFSNLSYMRVGRDCGPLCKAVIRINHLPSITAFPILNATLTLVTTSVPDATLLGKRFSLNESGYTGAINNLQYAAFPTGPYDSSFVTEYILSGSVTNLNVLTLSLINRCVGNPITYYVEAIENNGYMTQTMYLASMENSSEYRPSLSVMYGYNAPNDFISSSTSSPQKRYFLANTPSDYQNELLKTNDTDLYMTPYNQMEARGHFAFFANSNSSVKIYACYDGVYLSANNSSSGYPANGSMVEGRSTPSGEWLIVQLNNGYFVILLWQNPKLALTRTDNGIRVQNIGSTNTNQYWRICSTSSVTQSDGHDIENDTYYLNGYETRTFLIRDSSSTHLSAGTEFAIGGKMDWHIIFIGDHKYMIKSGYAPTKYLHVSASGVSAVEITGSTVPDAAVFTIESVSNGIYRFKSDAGYFLQSNASGLYASTSGNGYDRYWRLCKKSDYVEYNKNDIQAGYVMQVGNSLSLDFDKTFTDPADFTITVDDSTVATVSGNTISIIATGTVNCTLTHKPTGQTKDFAITSPLTYSVNSNASINSAVNRENIETYIRRYTRENPVPHNTPPSYYNSDYRCWKGDCANFVSQCLYAGGLSMDGANSGLDDEYHWYYLNSASISWIRASTFTQYWGKHSTGEIGRCYRYIEYDSNSFAKALQYWKSDIHVGDIIVEIAFENGGWEGNHIMIVSSVVTNPSNGESGIQIAGHTNDRLDHPMESLIRDNYRYAIIQLKND